MNGAAAPEPWQWDEPTWRGHVERVRAGASLTPDRWPGDASVALGTDRLVAWLRTQAKDRSGIWRDLAVRRRKTEVPTHYGEVVRVARRSGVATPLTERLLQHIHDLEAGGRMGEERLVDLAGRLD